MTCPKQIFSDANGNFTSALQFVKIHAMKIKIIPLVFIAAITITAHSQNLSAFDPRPNFSAIIVHNMDSSLAWYQSVFGLKIKSQLDEPEGRFKVVNLECATFSIELIEKKASLAPTETLKNKTEGTSIPGFFKTGFKVSDLDVYIKHLSRLKIPVGYIYTDVSSKKRNFLLNDPDGNVIQIFE